MVVLKIVLIKMWLVEIRFKAFNCQAKLLTRAIYTHSAI